MSETMEWDSGAARHDADTEKDEYAEYYGKNVGVSNHAEGGGYLFRTDELIVASEDTEDVESELTEMRPPVSHKRVRLSSRLDLLRLAPGGKPVCALVTELRAKERTDHRPPYRVFPNHVLYGNSHGFVKGG
ncbi:MAG: hypothetical protein QOD63_1013, partial [Actinomycetota bacterium]|nr:hypothetical protein [Actinomycetota bacterium]